MAKTRARDIRRMLSAATRIEFEEDMHNRYSNIAYAPYIERVGGVWIVERRVVVADKEVPDLQLLLRDHQWVDCDFDLEDKRPRAQFSTAVEAFTALASSMRLCYWRPRPSRIRLWWGRVQFHRERRHHQSY